MAVASTWTADLTAFFVYSLTTATIGPLLFGYHLAELNAPQDVITCHSTVSSTGALSLPQCIPMTQIEIGLVNSMFTLGGLVGALISGPAAAKFGRLPVMRLNTLFFMLGPVGEALASSVTILTAGRFVSGLGAGTAIVVAPIFVSEIAPRAKRGFYGAFTQVMINIGILSAQLLGMFLSRGQLWRIILAVGGGFGLLQAVGLIFAVESPLWLAEQGKTRTAKGILQRLRGEHCDISEEIQDWIFDPAENQDQSEEERGLLDPAAPLSRQSSSPSASTITAVESPRKINVGILQVITNRKYQRATFVVMVIMVAQQFCGINSVVMYGVHLLTDLLTTSAALLNVIVAILNLIVTIACAPLVDKLGRKPCLIASTMGMGISALLLGTAILSHIPVLSIVSVLTFVSSFGIGLGSIPFLLAAELVGPEAVGATQSWALAANWIATFIVAQFFPVVNKALGKGKVYFVFAVIAALFATFVVFLVPETKGKRDAEEVWARKPQREHES